MHFDRVFPQEQWMGWRSSHSCLRGRVDIWPIKFQHVCSIWVWVCVGQCLVHKDKTQLYESTAASESESSDQVRDIPFAGVCHDNRTQRNTSIFLFRCFLPLPFKRLSGRTFSSLFYAIEYMRHIGNSIVIQTCQWSVLANVCVVSLTLVRGEIWLVSSW